MAGVRVGASGGVEHQVILWTPFSNLRIGHLELGTPVMALQPGSTEHRIVTLGEPSEVYLLAKHVVRFCCRCDSTACFESLTPSCVL